MIKRRQHIIKALLLAALLSVASAVPISMRASGLQAADGSPLSVSVATSQPNCVDVLTGSAVITITGGKAPYMYKVNDGNFEMSESGIISLPDLGNGLYNIYIVDDVDETASFEFTVTPFALTITNAAVCEGEEATVSVEVDDDDLGMSHTFAWEGGISTSDSYTLAGTATPGIYSYDVTVTDGNGCEVTATATITVNEHPALPTIKGEPRVCPGNPVTFDLDNTTEPNTYEWTSSASLIAAGTTMTSCDLDIPTYFTLTVKDPTTGCTTTFTQLVTINDTVELEVTPATQAVCAGAEITPIECSAEHAVLSIRDDNLPTGLAFNSATGVISGSLATAGDYSFTVLATSDQTPPCDPKEMPVTITVNALPEVKATAQNSTNCDDDNGSITFTENAAYRYSIDNGANFQASHLFENLSSGTYHPVVKNNTTGCSVSLTEVEIEAEFSALTLALGTVPTEACANASTTISATANEAGASFQWLIDDVAQTGATSGDFQLPADMTAGTHTFKVVASYGGCTAKDSADVLINEAPTFNYPPTLTSISCHDMADGGISITAAGGTGTFQYALNGGTAQETGVFENLDAGDYIITVTDGNGCSSASTTISISQPDELTANITTVQETCEGNNGSATATVSGGTMPYTYLWSDLQTNATAINLTSLYNADDADPDNDGVYSVIIEDAHHCTVSKTVAMELNNNLVLNDIDLGSFCTGKMFYYVPRDGVDGNLPDGTSFTWDFGTALAGIADLECDDALCTNLEDCYCHPTAGQSGIRGVIVNHSDAAISFNFNVIPHYGVCVGTASQESITISANVDVASTVVLNMDRHDIDTVCPNETTAQVIVTAEGASATNHRIYWKVNGAVVQTKDYDTPETVGIFKDTLNIPIPANACQSEITYEVFYNDGTACEAETGGLIRVRTKGEWTLPADNKDTVECIDDATPFADDAIPTATDGCDNTLTGVLISSFNNVNAETKEGTMQYTYRYTACDGTYKDWTYTYTIDRTTPPTVQAANETVDVDCYTDPVAPTAIPQAIAVCGETLTAEGPTIEETGTDCNGTKTYIYTYTDCSGLKSYWRYTYNIKDDIDPVVERGYQTSYTLTSTDCHFRCPDVVNDIRNHAKDNCTTRADLEITQSPAANSEILLEADARVVNITVTVADKCHNSVEVIIPVNVPAAMTATLNLPDDNTLCPNFGTAEVSASTTNGRTPFIYAWAGATATTDNKADVAAAATGFCGKTYPVSVVVTDANGCTATDNGNFTVKTLATPIIAVVGGYELNKDLGCNPDVIDAPTTADFSVTAECETSPMVSISEPTDASDICQHTRTWKVSYAGICGNAAPITITRTWKEDHTAPQLVAGGIPAVELTTGTNCQYAIPDFNTEEYLNYFDEACSEITFVSQSVAVGELITANTTVAITVKDDCGNEATANVQVKVPEIKTMTVTANSNTWTYDGTSHSDAGYTLVFGTETQTLTASATAVLANNDQVSVAITGSRTNTGTAVNTVESVTVMRGEDDVTCEYNIVENSGTLTIDSALLTITINDTKLYDGAPLVTNFDNTAAVHVAGLVEGDALNAGSVRTNASAIGTYTLLGGTSTITEDFNTLNGITNYKTSIIVTQNILNVVCPSDLHIVLRYGACDTTITNVGGVDVDGGFSGHIGHTPIPNPLVAGSNITVGWNLYDDDDNLAEHLCDQVITVEYPACGTPGDSVSDGDGNRYSSVRIGCQCWTGENHHAKHYATMTRALPEISTHKKYNDSDSLAAIYGYLYTWYSAVGVDEGDDSAQPALTSYGRVRGICPDGWAIPTAEEYAMMVAASGDVWQAKSPSTLHWVPGQEGRLPGSGFNARGAGSYSPVAPYYESLMTAARFWTVDGARNGENSATYIELGACESEECLEASKGLGFSVRCIRVR